MTASFDEPCGFPAIVTQQAVAEDQQIEEASRPSFHGCSRARSGTIVEACHPSYFRNRSQRIHSRTRTRCIAMPLSRLDEFSLRCWIIQRLMLDDGLDHESAERAFEHARDAREKLPLGVPHCSRQRRTAGQALRLGDTQRAFCGNRHKLRRRSRLLHACGKAAAAIGADADPPDTAQGDLVDNERSGHGSCGFRTRASTAGCDERAGRRTQRRTFRMMMPSCVPTI